MIFQTPFVSLPVNFEGRDFVVGDVHGQGALLDHLLEIVRFDPDRDRLIALGDLVDRGRDSEKLLCRVRDQASFLSLRGNHEAMLLGSAQDWEVARIWNRNQNEWAANLAPERLAELARIVEGMPLAFELPLIDGRRIGLVHAELAVNQTWPDMRNLAPAHRDAIDDSAMTASASLIWGRRRIRDAARMATARGRRKLDAAGYVKCWELLQPIDGIDQVIAGHTVLAKGRPVAISNLLFIETGAFLPEGRLTLVEPLKAQYWQARFVEGKSRVLRRAPTPLPVPFSLKAQWRPTDAMREAAHLARQVELDTLRRFWP